ncbi:MFS general substrate transporter [Mycena filopes]|nr:MFS general substrate transporter [Mycena filopes]
MDGSRWRGTARVLGPSYTHLPTLTIGLLGVQIFWSVEMSYASPYLLSLGLSTSHVALVFLAGPLSGLIVQPLIGAVADTSTSRWGRRRPFILLGCLLCVVGMLLLGYTKGVAAWIFERGGHAHNVLTVILAILAIFVIDFSINAVQAVDRALLVDTLPPAQQAAGNACAALMLGFGSVVGFFVGNLPLRTLLPFLHADSELQALSVLVSIVLLACHALTAALVRERVLLAVVGAPHPSLKHELREIITHARALPRVIRQICVIQFFAWLGWFPVLFYTTMYITDVYIQSESESAAADADAPTRLGARAQLLSALVALAANALLPFPWVGAKSWVGAECMGGEGARVPLPTLWAVSHAVFAGCMVGSFFTHSVPGATLLITCTGFAWGVTQWAPFSLAQRHTPAQNEEEEGFLVSRPGEESDSDDERDAMVTARERISPRTGEGNEDEDVASGSGSELEFVKPYRARGRDPDPFADGIGDGSEGRKGKGRALGEEGEEYDTADESDEQYADAEERPPPRHSRQNSRSKRSQSKAQTLLGNPAAQLSVVDVLTPRSTWGEFEGEGGLLDEHRQGVDFDAERGLMGSGDPGEGAGQGGGLSAKAGVILGIHNIFIVIPQFLVTGLSAAIFAVFDGQAAPVEGGAAGDEAETGRNSVVVVFRCVCFPWWRGAFKADYLLLAPRPTLLIHLLMRITFSIGGIWASIAFVLAWRLARELRRR